MQENSNDYEFCIRLALDNAKKRISLLSQEYKRSKYKKALKRAPFYERENQKGNKLFRFSFHDFMCNSA